MTPLPPYPICFGTFSICPSDMERYCVYRSQCWKREAEKEEARRG